MTASVPELLSQAIGGVTPLVRELQGEGFGAQAKHYWRVASEPERREVQAFARDHLSRATPADGVERFSDLLTLTAISKPAEAEPLLERILKRREWARQRLFGEPIEAKIVEVVALFSTSQWLLEWGRSVLSETLESADQRSDRFYLSLALLNSAGLDHRWTIEWLMRSISDAYTPGGDHDSALFLAIAFFLRRQGAGRLHDALLQRIDAGSTFTVGEHALIRQVHAAATAWRQREVAARHALAITSSVLLEELPQEDWLRQLRQLDATLFMRTVDAIETAIEKRLTSLEMAESIANPELMHVYRALDPETSARTMRDPRNGNTIYFTVEHRPDVLRVREATPLDLTALMTETREQETWTSVSELLHPSEFDAFRKLQ